MSRNTLALTGLRSTPLASYLGALGLFRLVSEQADATARGFWRDGVFHLQTQLDRADLLLFLLEGYAPTPVTNPWNADGGFRLGKRPGAADFIESMEVSAAPRFKPYRDTLVAVRAELARYAGRELKDFRDELKASLRDRLPDVALDWYDAVLVIAEGGFGYAPLFGSGGNDGSQDFSKGFLQALSHVIDFGSGAPTKRSRALLESALLGQPVKGLTTDTAGQFAPSLTGGVNRTSGMGANSQSNPWGLVLLVEGGLVFAASVTRKLDGGSTRVSFPFTVRPVPAGYASASQQDTTGGRSFETWVPLWGTPSRFPEIRALFREGRATQGRRPVRTGTDFALAVGRLGIDRGIEGFERFGAYERNGNNYFVTPLGPWTVPAEPADGLEHLSNAVIGWIDGFRRHVGTRHTASLGRLQRRIDEALLGFARSTDDLRLVELLAALGDAERHAWLTQGSHELRPLPAIPTALLTSVLPAGLPSAELRLAASVAAVDLRLRRNGVIQAGRHARFAAASDPRVTWRRPSPTDALLEVVQRRYIEERSTASLRFASPAGHSASLDDVRAFLDGSLDDDTLADALSAMSIVESPAHARRPTTALSAHTAYCLMAPVVMRTAWRRDAAPWPQTSGVVPLAVAGRARAVGRLCAGRLRAMGVRPTFQELIAHRETLRRSTAALAFPLSPADQRRLIARVGLLPAPDASDALEAS